MSCVVGADVARGRWVAVVLANHRFEEAVLVDTLVELQRRLPESDVLALDIPIGLPPDGESWPRQADVAARDFLGPRRASVFLAPPQPVLACTSYDAANRVHRELTTKGLSRQTWGLCRKILEAEAFASTHPSTVEVHPEVSFRAMNGAPLGNSKKTWNGQMARRRLLNDHGVILPDRLDLAGTVPPDDLLDAAAAAWTAWRVACGHARRLPPEADGCDNVHDGVIWY